jgi:hypothetical protein
LFTESVLLVGIGWYFPGIYHTDTKGNLDWFILVSKFWQEPLFPSKKGGFGPLLEHSAPLLREKRVSRGFIQKKSSQKLQKRVPAKSYSKKIPTGYQPISSAGSIPKLARQPVLGW